MVNRRIVEKPSKNKQALKLKSIEEQIEKRVEHFQNTLNRPGPVIFSHKYKTGGAASNDMVTVITYKVQGYQRTFLMSCLTKYFEMKNS